MIIMMLSIRLTYHNLPIICTERLCLDSIRLGEVLQYPNFYLKSYQLTRTRDTVRFQLQYRQAEILGQKQIEDLSQLFPSVHLNQKTLESWLAKSWTSCRSIQHKLPRRWFLQVSHSFHEVSGVLQEIVDAV